jgi:hypothetical protein
MSLAAWKALVQSYQVRITHDFSQKFFWHDVLSRLPLYKFEIQKKTPYFPCDLIRCYENISAIMDAKLHAFVFSVLKNGKWSASLSGERERNIHSV